MHLFELLRFQGTKATYLLELAKAMRANKAPYAQALKPDLVRYALMTSEL